MEQEIRNKISSLGLENSYLLLGRKDNVFEYLQAMDLFLLPSLHEGFPVTLVEAQTSGLPCLVAETITRDVDLTGQVTFISLEESPSYWAEKASSLSRCYQRRSYRHEVIDAGFDVSARVEDFEKLILDLRD